MVSLICVNVMSKYDGFRNTFSPVELINHLNETSYFRETQLFQENYGMPLKTFFISPNSP